MQVNPNCCLNNSASFLFLLTYIPTCTQRAVHLELSASFFFFFFSLWRIAKSGGTFHFRMCGNKTSAHQFLIRTLVKRATLILSLEDTALIDGGAQGIEHRGSSRTQELKQILTSPSVSVILTQTCPSESSATQLCYGNWAPCLPKLNQPLFPTLLVFSAYVEVEPC